MQTFSLTRLFSECTFLGNFTGDINWEDYMSESDTSGSDSSCDDGLPVHLLAIAPKLQRKKKMRSRRERGKLISHKVSYLFPHCL